ncbi:NAD(P)/FAD-dependent oxidoreductase [Candidatus Saccharibacteria bacterium]|nr:NAD(P)/FAD-dependent oxidoreductase [Candidatus Saccharibacteria bacterium]
MRKKFDFDVIVLGSGVAGTAAALSCASAKQKVAVVECGKWGGSSLNSYDVPSRALFEFSHLYSSAKRGSRFGLSVSSLRYNYPTAQNWRSLAMKRAGANSKKLLEDAKITCVSGYAAFLSPYEIAVGDNILAAQKFIISTGASPTSGDISCLSSASCLTPAEALRLPRPPKSVFIVGGGSTGCELASYFSELGSEVVLGELAGRLLPREDEEVGQLLSRHFESVSRIKVLAQSRVVAVERIPKSPSLQKVIFLRGGQEKSVTTNAVVLATGSAPSLNLSLENAGVAYEKSGIKVDEMLRTTMKHIFAAGDCIGGESSSERAAYEGALAAANLAGRQKNYRNYEGFIRLTDTFPSVATTGLTEDDCVRKGIKCKKAVLPLSAVSASNISDFRSGFVKLLSDSKDKLLGATVVCPSAELVIQEVAVAVRHRFTVTQLASTPHISSSWSELVHLAAKKLAK